MRTGRVGLGRVDARRVRAVGIRELRAAVLRAVPREGHTAGVATTSRQRRTAMIARHVGLVAAPAAAIVAVPMDRVRINRGPTSRAPTSRVRMRHVRTLQVGHDRRAGPMVKAGHRVRAVHLAMPATPPSSAAGMCPMASIPARARHVRAAIRIPRDKAQDDPVPVVRASRVLRAHRTVLGRIPVRTSSAPSPLDHKAIVHQADLHAGRTPGLVAIARKGRVRRATGRTSLAARAAHREMRVHKVHVRIGPMLLAARTVHATKACRATRIDLRSLLKPVDRRPVGAATFACAAEGFGHRS